MKVLLKFIFSQVCLLLLLTALGHTLAPPSKIPQLSKQEFIRNMLLMFPPSQEPKPKLISFIETQYDQLNGRIHRYIETITDKNLSFHNREILLQADTTLVLLGLRPWNLTFPSPFTANIYLLFCKINPQLQHKIEIFEDQKSSSSSIYDPKWIKHLRESGINFQTNDNLFSPHMTLLEEEQQPQNAGYLYGIPSEEIQAYNNNEDDLKSRKKALIFNPLQNIWVRDLYLSQKSEDILWRIFYPQLSQKRIIFINSILSYLSTEFQKKYPLEDFLKEQKIHYIQSLAKASTETNSFISPALTEFSIGTLQLLYRQYFSPPAIGNREKIINSALNFFEENPKNSDLINRLFENSNPSVDDVNTLQVQFENHLLRSSVDIRNDLKSKINLKSFMNKNPQLGHQLTNHPNHSKLMDFFKILQQLVENANHPDGTLTVLYKALRLLDNSVQITNQSRSIEKIIEELKLNTQTSA